jgi:hypothetical protein
MMNDGFKPQSQRGSADLHAKKDKPEAIPKWSSCPIPYCKRIRTAKPLSKEEEKKAFKGLKAHINCGH